MRNKFLNLRLLVLPLLALLISPGKADSAYYANGGYSDIGIEGYSLSNYYGLYGYSAQSVGVFGYGPNSIGVYGYGYYGVYGYGTSGYAGYFNGSVYITGTLIKGAGSFKIDDPLDPGNKYLSHSFVESPDMMNIYNGIAVLDAKGEAWVQMPKWFEALNRDFRYQLTGISSFAPVYIGQEMVGNRFKIAGGKPGMKISWQVSGIRHDAYANAHRIGVEENKPVAERGHYLHPELYGQGVEKGVMWAHRPEMMQQQLAKKPGLGQQLVVGDKDTRLKEQATEIAQLKNESKNMRAELDQLKKQLSALAAPNRTLASQPVASTQLNK